jgi:hypothetical protein
MKRINGIILTLALLVAGAITVKAQKSETLSHYECSITYSFSGGKITESNEEHPFEHYYKVDISPGETITATAKANDKKFVNMYMVEEPPYVQFVFRAFDDAGKEIKDETHTSVQKDTEVNFSYTVSANCDHIKLSMSRPISAPRYAKVEVTFNVKKNATTTTPPTTATTPTPPKPDEVKAENYKGTFERHGGKMEYSFTNCKVTYKKEDNKFPNYDLHPYYNTTVAGAGIGSYIKGNVKPGAAMTLACKKVKGNTTLDSVMIQVEVTNGANTLIKKTYKGKGALSRSLQVPKNADRVSVCLAYAYLDATFQTRIDLDVAEELPDVPGNKFKWNIVADDDRCKHCKGLWSEYTINWGSTSEYATMCNSEKNWHQFDIDSRNVTNIFYNDHIATNGERLTLSKGETHNNYHRDEEIIFRGNTHAWLRKRLDDGTDRWSFYKGFIIGKHLKRSGKPSSSFETNELVVVPKGTIYILQKDDNTTKAYLLQGSMDVTNRKNNKKVTLKPGQVATGTKNGQMTLQTFDVQAMAKKYGISTSELQGVPSSTTTTPTTPNRHNNTNTAEVRRYETERAIVKYKVTTGTAEGVMAKAFDNYGQLERRELKMGNQTTLQLTQGNSSYSLNTQAKTYTQVTNAELNFLNMNDPVMQKLKLKKKGTAKVLNRECTIYANSDTEFYVWKGIVLKKVAHTKKGITTTEATSVELPASVDSKYFNMPAGYRKK